MEQINKRIFKELAELKFDEGCVTIFIPTHKAGKEVNEGVDKLTLKNALREAERHFLKFYEPQKAKQILQPARALLTDTRLWQYMDEGLALFIAPSYFDFYKIPVKPELFVFFGDQFYLSPLIPLISQDTRFFFVSVSKEAVRIYNANKYSYELIDTGDLIPKGMDDALSTDEHEKELQFHSGSNTGTGAQFYGTDNGDEKKKDDVRRYLHKVSDGLMKFLDNEHVPLVLCGVEYEVSMLRTILPYAHVVEGGVYGNMQHVDSNHLHAEAWSLVEPIYNRVIEKAEEYYENLLNTNKVSSRIEEIVPASEFSKVDKLFLVNGAHVWGHYDPVKNKVLMHMAYRPGDDDLVNKAAVNTVLNGGEVYILNQPQMPNHSNYIAAIFRY